MVGRARQPAIGATLRVQEEPELSAVTITVDTVNEIATVGFTDDKGDTNAAAPAGAVVTFTSDNPAAATVAADATNPLQGNITPVAEGVTNIGATVADASGNPLLEADGVTPWAAIVPVALTVNPGAAVGAVLTAS